jgi:hypothetical protein
LCRRGTVIRAEGDGIDQGLASRKGLYRRISVIEGIGPGATTLGPD